MLNFRGVVILVWFPFFTLRKSSHLKLTTPRWKLRTFEAIHFLGKRRTFGEAPKAPRKNLAGNVWTVFFYESVKVLQDFDVILNTRICDFPRFSRKFRALERMEKAFKSSCEE